MHRIIEYGTECQMREDFTYRLVIDEPREVRGRAGGLDGAHQPRRLPHLELGASHGDDRPVRREVCNGVSSHSREAVK